MTPEMEENEEQSDVEYELKAKVPSFDVVASLVDAAEYLGRTHDSDQYFDTPSRALYSHGAFLRTRNGLVVDLKSPLEQGDTMHLSCRELRVPLDGQPARFQSLAEELDLLLETPRSPTCSSFECLKACFSLEYFIMIRKERTMYRLDGADLMLDEVEALGLFIEIEVVDEGKRNYWQDKFHNLELSHLAVGYVELLLREVEPATYRLGRYLLEQDR